VCFVSAGGHVPSTRQRVSEAVRARGPLNSETYLMTEYGKETATTATAAPTDVSFEGVICGTHHMHSKLYTEKPFGSSSSECIPRRAWGTKNWYVAEVVSKVQTLADV